MKQLNWYQIFGKSNIPDGRTVLPTDDIQIWLHCANIWDKSYTTLAEVLADTDTLLALISSNNAVDYMVRSTTWAVAQSLVPVMTDNTHPSGVCSASSELNSSYAAWKAFDGDDATRWQSVEEAPNYSHCGYCFDNAEKVFKAYIKGRSDNNSIFKVRCSDDGITWSDLSENVTLNSSNGYSYTFDLSPLQAHRYYDFYGRSSNTGYGCQIYTAQFYSASITEDATAMTYIGQNNYCANTLLADATWKNAICNSEYFESVLNVKAPTMTSYTVPSGECISSGDFSSDYAWKAFDGNDNTMYSSSGTGTGGGLWLGYTFPSATKVYLAKAVHRVNTDQTTTVSFKYQSKTANGEWKNISDDFSVVFHGDKPTTSVIVAGGDEDVSYRIYRNNATVGTRLVMWTLQFYGREDV